jgi:hypothetical protein
VNASSRPYAVAALAEWSPVHLTDRPLSCAVAAHAEGAADESPLCTRRFSAGPDTGPATASAASWAVPCGLNRLRREAIVAQLEHTRCRYAPAAMHAPPQLVLICFELAMTLFDAACKPRHLLGEEVGSAWRHSARHARRRRLREYATDLSLLCRHAREGEYTVPSRSRFARTIEPC